MLNLPQKDSAAWRALITAGQAIVAFFVGLILVVWNVPGVPDAVIYYTQQNLLTVLGFAGVTTGAASFLWNLIVRKDVKTY